MQSIAFKNFVILQRGFDLPKKDMMEGDYPVIGSTSIIGHHNEYKVEPPGVITGRSGSLGQVQYINEPYWPHNTALWVRDFKGNNPKYVYYILKTLDLARFNSGAGVPTLNRNHLDEMVIVIHEPDTQRLIADILSTYDDLIENNTRRIRVLEQMAQALYQEWFGKIKKESLPKRWKTVIVGDVCNVGRGSSPRPIVDQKYFEGGTIPWIKIADATKSGKYLYETKEHVNEYGASFSKLLPMGSLILAASGTLGFPQLLGVDGCVHDGWLYINEFDGVTRDYLYYVFQSKQVFFNNSAYGAAIQNINTTILREMEIILPPIELQNKFSNYISEIDQLLQNIEKSNTNLRQTRDLLLPRLVSGEIEVSFLS